MFSKLAKHAYLLFQKSFLRYDKCFKQTFLYDFQCIKSVTVFAYVLGSRSDSRLNKINKSGSATMKTRQQTICFTKKNANFLSSAALFLY